VKGKVRVREDRVQMSCEEVRLYQPSEEKVEETKEAETAQLPAEVQPLKEEAVPGEAAMENRRLVISINQTSDAEGDKASLYRIREILQSFPGHDEVNLKVTNGSKTTRMRFFDIFADYCPELHERLVAVVGEEGLKLEKK